MSMIQLPRPIGMPAMLTVYWASRRPWAAARWPASAATTANSANMKNAADAARHLRSAIDGAVTKTGKGFPQIPQLETIVLSENTSFLWFSAAIGRHPILSALDLPFAGA